MKPPADTEKELRRELTINALWHANGSRPTEEEIEDHLAEMDRHGSRYGAHQVNDALDAEARARAEKKQREDDERNAKDEADRERARKEREREERLAERQRRADEEQRRLIAEREQETRPSEDLATLPEDENQ